MGLIGRILNFARVVRGLDSDVYVSEVKIDTGGGANTTADYFSAPGDDSFPLKTDYAVTLPLPNSGRGAIVGCVDPVNAPAATEGDKRIYARDPTDGSVAVELWLKSDKSAILLNALGSITLAANGDVTINGVTIDTSGNISGAGTIDATGDITTVGEVTAGTVTLSMHVHLYNDTGAAVNPATTQIPTP